MLKKQKESQLERETAPEVHRKLRHYQHPESKETLGPGFQERHRLDIPDLLQNGSRLKAIKLTGKFDKEYEPESSEKIKKTSFLQGTFKTHEVVVKKVLKDKDNDYPETLEFYRRCHDLTGVVRLEFAESFDECHYLAFPVCMGNLEAVFKKDVSGVLKNEHELACQKIETEDPLVGKEEDSNAGISVVVNGSGGEVIDEFIHYNGKTKDLELLNKDSEGFELLETYSLQFVKLAEVDCDANRTFYSDLEEKFSVGWETGNESGGIP
nr:hypothetical protein [Tanacetum cinerariifolium]